MYARPPERYPIALYFAPTNLFIHPIAHIAFGRYFTSLTLENDFAWYNAFTGVLVEQCI